MNAQALIDRLVVNPGLPEGLAHQLLRGALDELCTQSGVWKASRKMYVRSTNQQQTLIVAEGYEASYGEEIAMPEPPEGMKRVAVTGLPGHLSVDLDRGVIVDVAGELDAGDAIAWTDVLAPRTDNGRFPGAEIPLPKVADGTRRVGIFNLSWRGNRPWGNSLVPDVHRGVLVDRAGCVKAGDELAWTDVLTPEEDWSEVPEEVLGALAPAAEWLARARAFEMHGRPWSNPNLALAARREYSRELSGLLRREITGNNCGPLVAAMPEAFFDE